MEESFNAEISRTSFFQTKNVNKRLQKLSVAIGDDPQANATFPGLKDALVRPSLPGTNDEGFVKELVTIFKDCDSKTYSRIVAGLPKERQIEIDQTISPLSLDYRARHGKSQIPVSYSFFMLLFNVKGWVSQSWEDFCDWFWSLWLWNDPFVKEVRQLLKEEGGKKGDIQFHKKTLFQNWGKIPFVAYRPNYTCVPSTVVGVKAIVKASRRHDWGIRCSGYRHSWSPVFGRTEVQEQVLISLLPVWRVTHRPDLTALAWSTPPNELETIDVAGNLPNGNTLVRVGAAVTNESLRRWCLKENKYMLPLNVIMVEITLGGSNAPICHGAGLTNRTLSDLVRKIEYVDCHGVHQTIENPDHLRAASGCFGLIGVVTHLTLEFEPMKYTRMQPEKLPAIRAVPPPEGMKKEDIPPALYIELSDEEKAEDIRRFEEHCESDFYAEWFWFPYHDKVWVNCWKDIDDGAGAEPVVNTLEITIQVLGQVVVNFLQQSKLLKDVIEGIGLTEFAITVLSRISMANLPAPQTPMHTYVTDALHFQRGIQNMEVLDVEVEMPIPEKKDNPGQRDLNMIRRAWWDAIVECYKVCDAGPQSMPLEMRIMGDSDVIMAPQRGNTLGTCSIEILTLSSARDTWVPYAQKVLDKWMSYTDGNGKRLATRPHWAKQWHEFTVDGRPWKEKLLEDYHDAIVEFRARLGAIGEEHGWKLEDLKASFSNDILDEFFLRDL